MNFASENGLQSWQQCDVTMARNFAVRSRRRGWEQQASRYGFLRYVAF
ncbi:hypothetical protein ACNKHL_23325 [Shigella flexneri]